MQICADAGWLAVPFSPIEIEADEEALRRLPERFRQSDAVFWVSPTAIETAAPHLDFSDGLKKQITVGQASRKILAAFCPHEIFSPSSGNDSEAVLRLDLWKEMPKGSSVLIVRGHGGRDLLASELRRKGFKVSYAEVYFRRPNSLNWQDFNPHSIKAAYVASGELVQALFRQVPSQFSPFFKSLLYFTHHPRIADTLRLVGAERVRVIPQFDAAVLNEAANEPDTADIVAARNRQPEKSDQQPNKVAAGQPDADKENTAAPDERDTVPPSETVAATSENNAGPSEKQTAGEITGNTMSSEPKQIPQTSANPVVIRQSSGKGLAVGALVLALLGLGASGFLFVEGQNVLKNQQLEFSQKLDKAALGESENAALLKDNINRQTVIQSELERLGNGQKANAEQIVLTQKAYQELAKGRANWLADEAETLLNQASQQLVLSGNVQGAISVLEHIHNRLGRFDQPELLAIKQAVSSDLASLKNHPYVDISGTALRIDRLETAVAGLPLLLDGTLKPSKNEEPASNPNLSWWENAWEKSLGALKGLVEVRRLDNNDAMLIAPDQVYFVRENLRLRLLDARTALMQRNSEVYQSDLNNAEAAVRQYFDNKSPATQSWLKELADLKSLDIRPVAEDALQSSRAAVYAYQEGIRRQTPEMPLIAAPAVVTPAPAQPAVPAVPALPSENRAASAAEQQAVPKAGEPAPATQPKPQVPKAPAAIKRPQVPAVPARPEPATPKAPAADQPPMRDFINRNPPAQTDPTPSADTSPRGDQA